MGNGVLGKRKEPVGLLARYGFSISLYAAVGGIAYLSLASPQDVEAPVASQVSVPAGMSVREIASRDLPAPTRVAREMLIPPAAHPTLVSSEEGQSKRVPVPIRKPTPENARDVAVSRVPADVQLFDRCMPACETGDPMRTASISPLAEPTPTMEISFNANDDAESFAPLRSARMILHRTASMPGSLLRSGRSAVERVVGDW
ncbi:hypothetical protein [Rhizobium sp. 18055]|uniref:hypothetical protein n=1 Tax=Rhizobium sp. 18055 TaxID=2681403 RepID=UPI001356DC76|nr:hypothetical protein [Rhizobium sp. 18055]